MSEESKGLATQENKSLSTQPEASLSVRFMNKVMTEFTSGVGEVALTKFQKRLAQNYFIAVNTTLQKAELKRLKKEEKYRDPVPVTWANVNMEGLAQDVVACARIGLDPAQRNHIGITPFKNNSTNKYDLVFIEGYRGVELKAEKYGLNVPDQIVVELVFSTDKFRSVKKSFQNKVESYEFEITNEFDRGAIIGGFYYHGYSASPEKNKLVVMSLKDILKRKPKYASPEFWGGEKDKWENGKKVGKEQTDGWFEKMAYKTVYRAAYGDITIDSQKIDDDFLRLRSMEDSIAESRADAEILEHANVGEIIDIEPMQPEAQPIIEPETQATGTDGPSF
jgi:recombination protein RecT